MKKLFLLLVAALLTGAIAPAAAQPNAAKNRITPPRYGEGGIENFSKWLSDRLQCPETAAADSTELRLFFSVEPDGSMGDVRLATRLYKGAFPSDEVSDEVDPALAAEVNRALESVDRWTPSRRKNKAVRSKEYIDIRFRKDTAVVVYRYPQFEGQGINAFRAWFREGLKYPVSMLMEEETGRLVFKFIIDREGNLTDPVVIESAHSVLNQAAYKRLAACPKWEPAFSNGKFVRASYMLPVEFQIRSKTPPAPKPDQHSGRPGR